MFLSLGAFLFEITWVEMLIVAVTATIGAKTIVRVRAGE